MEIIRLRDQTKVKRTTPFDYRRDVNLSRDTCDATRGRERKDCRGAYLAVVSPRRVIITNWTIRDIAATILWDSFGDHTKHRPGMANKDTAVAVEQ